ncbi:MAG: hypothetical protein E4H27_04695 [Anaerolineales bacterium]|nr:MAG: hypothetical protein E4H27_04695 [Anaerolineales bacterium]
MVTTEQCTTILRHGLLTTMGESGIGETMQHFIEPGAFEAVSRLSEKSPARFTNRGVGYL